MNLRESLFFSRKKDNPFHPSLIMNNVVIADMVIEEVLCKSLVRLSLEYAEVYLCSLCPPLVYEKCNYHLGSA